MEVPLLCKVCPHSDKCQTGEVPGSEHCFAVLQNRNPLISLEECAEIKWAESKTW